MLKALLIALDVSSAITANSYPGILASEAQAMCGNDLYLFADVDNSR